jgi:hypothetical protein
MVYCIKVVCIDNHPVWKNEYEVNDLTKDNIDKILTVGKIYYVIQEDEGEIYNDYLIEHDKGIRRWFSKSRFVTIEQWREQLEQKFYILSISIK